MYVFYRNKIKTTFVLTDVNVAVIWNLERLLCELNLSLPVKTACFVLQLRQYRDEIVTWVIYRG